MKPGTLARVGFSHDYDPEHAYVFATHDSARDGVKKGDDGLNTHQVPSGGMVTIVSVDPTPVNGKHLVEIKGSTGATGWVVGEDVLLPIPPINTALIVPKTVNGVPQDFFPEQDTDEGVPVGVPTKVSYLGFYLNPGNPEYEVHIDSGPMAGRTAFVLAQELQLPATHAFRLVPPQ